MKLLGSCGPGVGPLVRIGRKVPAVSSSMRENMLTAGRHEEGPAASAGPSSTLLPVFDGQRLFLAFLKLRGNTGLLNATAGQVQHA